MKRFFTSLALAALGVVTLGGGIAVLVPADRAVDLQASGAPLGQTEDATEEEGATEGVSPTQQLLPIEALLEQLEGPGGSSALPTGQRVLLSRDPFTPVVPAASAGDGGGDGNTDGGSDGGTDGGSDGGTDGGTGDGDGDGGDACSGDEAETVCDGVVVTLSGFTEGGLAIVGVNGTSFTVGVEDEFATSFRVLALNDPCATLLYGDEAFSICAGATVLK